MVIISRLAYYYWKGQIDTDLRKVFEERRSVNFFNSRRKIEEDILQNIINLAVLAPSAFNLQPWEIIAVESDEAKEKLFALASNQPKIKEAPITLIVIGDWKDIILRIRHGQNWGVCSITRKH